jgi:hypothetical protein
MDEDELTERDLLLAIFEQVRTIKWILATVYVAGLLGVLVLIAEAS